MLYNPLFRRALTFNLIFTTPRPITHIHRGFSTSPFALASSSSSMSALPPSSFILPRSIFNSTLYNNLFTFWFADIPANATTQSEAALSRWYGLGGEEQKAQFDEECRKNFGYALEAVGPGKLALPAWEGYEKDVERAGEIAKPFVDEVKEAQMRDGDGKEAADTLLALCLLLDQITRNVYRDPEGLKLVFNHYDRLAHTLVHASMSLNPNPVHHPAYTLRPVVKNWYLMPLMHAEHLPSHSAFRTLTEQCRDAVHEAGDTQAKEQLDNSLDFIERHSDPLRRFGRYPHRNEALGRESSGEEVEFLGTAETFGVKQGQGQTEGEDESKKGKVKEKSEL